MMVSRLMAALGTLVTTSQGDILVGGSGSEALTSDATVVGLAGMGGNDTLTGGAGRDFLFGDFFSLGFFDDGDPYDFTVTGDDKLYGGGGKDLLFAGPGRDSLYGGVGDDTYFLQGGGLDKLVEDATGGSDTIVTNLTTYTLPKYFENLEFFDLLKDTTKASHGIGNAAGNWLNGGTGADTLEGLGGNDTLSGNSGHDLLIGGAGRDVFAFGFGINYRGADIFGKDADTISDFDGTQDRISLIGFPFNPMRQLEGPLKATQFGLVGGTLTGKELVLYDQDTGTLTNNHSQVFAHVTPGLALTFHDFVWF